MADVQLSTRSAAVKQAYEANADTNAFTDDEKAKLAGIETGADITDAENVAASGAFMIEGNTLDDIAEGLNNKQFTQTLETKLESIQTGAEVNAVFSVAGKQEDVVLDKNDVGLASVDNTSDADKPVSTAQQAALDLKVSSDISGITGADPITNMVSLTQSEYNALTPDSSTFYVITDA